MGGQIFSSGSNIFIKVNNLSVCSYKYLVYLLKNNIPFHMNFTHQVADKNKDFINIVSLFKLYIYYYNIEIDYLMHNEINDLVGEFNNTLTFIYESWLIKYNLIN